MSQPAQRQTVGFDGRVAEHTRHTHLALDPDAAVQGHGATLVLALPATDPATSP